MNYDPEIASNRLFDDILTDEKDNPDALRKSFCFLLCQMMLFMGVNDHIIGVLD